MNTYTMKENLATGAAAKPVSAWQKPRFQSFAMIVVGSALLFSLVAISTLTSAVDNVTQKKIPYIQSQLARSGNR